MDTSESHVGQARDGEPDSKGVDERDGGVVSEAGSSALNPGAALGGADSVPDTPDVNDSGEDEDEAPALNVPDEHDAAT